MRVIIVISLLFASVYSYTVTCSVTSTFSPDERNFTIGCLSGEHGTLALSVYYQMTQDGMGDSSVIFFKKLVNNYLDDWSSVIR